MKQDRGFTHFTDSILQRLEDRLDAESSTEYELRTRDHIIYCEHGTPYGQPCYFCQNPQALTEKVQ